MVKVSTSLTGLQNGQLKHNEIPALAIRGRAGVGSGLGFMVCGRARLGNSIPGGGIYRRGLSGYNQNTDNPSTRRKTIIVKMREYAPTNPRSIAQQTNRGKFADAIAAWQALTDEQKHDYNQRVKRRGLDGYRLFISEYLKSH